MDKGKTGELTKSDFTTVKVSVSQIADIFFDASDQNNEGSSLETQNAKVGQVLKKIGETLTKAGYSLLEIARTFDLHGTGVITKSELTGLLKQKEVPISLSEIRVLTGYLLNVGYGKIYTDNLITKLHEVLNLTSDGLYSKQQVIPILKRVLKEIEGRSETLSEEILKYDKIINTEEQKAITCKSGIEKHNFYKILSKFGVLLSDDEKSILSTVFGIHLLPSMFDTNALMNMLESLPVTESSTKQHYTIEWERRIYRKLGNFLRSRTLTLQDFFADSMDSEGYVSIEEFNERLSDVDLSLGEREIMTLANVARNTADGRINVKRFAKQFYDTYLLDAEIARLQNMTKEDEVALVLDVVKKIKEKSANNSEKAFTDLDNKKLGFLTLTGLQFGLPQTFGINLTRDQLFVVLHYMDTNEDGIVSLKEFSIFYNTIEDKLTKSGTNIKAGDIENTLRTIGNSLIKILREKKLTLLEIFNEFDYKRRGYISLDEFTDLLQTIGFIMSGKKASDLLKAIEPNFSGKVTYRTLYKLVQGAADRKGIHLKEWGGEELFKWRDRAIEAIIRGLNSLNKSPKEYFYTFDGNNDGLLAPREFREALKQLRNAGVNISRGQIDRILLIFATNNQAQQTAIDISKVVTFLAQYDISPFYAQEKPGTEELMVNEDMFVMIVQHFDGFSVLLNKSGLICEKAEYIVSHKKEYFTRGCSLFTNYFILERLKKNSKKLALNLNDAMVNLSLHSLNLIKSAALSSLADPLLNTTGKYLIDNETDIVKEYTLPNIDPSLVQISKKSKVIYGNGYTCYKGTIISSGQSVRIMKYESSVLNKQSADGKVFLRHLEVELATQVMLYEINPNLTFKILGKYEKQRGIGEYSVDLYVVIEEIPETDYILLQNLLSVNGGLLQLPLLKNTETALYIAKLWTNDILEILGIIHSYRLIMRILGPSHLYLNRQTLRIKIGHFFGIGKIDSEGKINMCPNLELCSPYADINDKDQVYDDASLAPEHLFNSFTSHTKDLDTWSFGSLVFYMLIGSPPPSYFKLYKDWYYVHKECEFKKPFIEPSNLSFVYDPLSAIDINIRNERIQIIGSGQGEYLLNNNKRSKNTLSLLENQSYSTLIEGKGWLSPYKKLGEKSEARNTLRAKRHSEIARQLIEAMSSNSVKEKSFLGLMLDMIACCLDPKPQNRPDLNFLRGSPIFSLDGYERDNAIRFAEVIFLYRDPVACITNQITKPLRKLCLDTIRNSDRLISELEPSILAIIEKLFEHIRNLSMGNIRKSQGDIAKATAPYIFLAQRIIADRVIDMIIFLCHKYTKQFNLLKRFDSSKTILKKENVKPKTQKDEGRRIRFADESKISETEYAKTDYNLSMKAQLFNSKFRSDNNVLTATCELLNELVKEMQYKESIFAGYAGKVLEYVIKLLIGESYVLASDLVFTQQNEKRALELKTFLRNKADFTEHFVPDELDKAWYTLQHNKRIINYEIFWDHRSYLTVLPLYQGKFSYASF